MGGATGSDTGFEELVFFFFKQNDTCKFMNTCIHNGKLAALS